MTVEMPIPRSLPACFDFSRRCGKPFQSASSSAFLSSARHIGHLVEAARRRRVWKRIRGDESCAAAFRRVHADFRRGLIDEAFEQRRRCPAVPRRDTRRSVSYS